MNDTNLLNSLLCSGSNIDVLKSFGSYIFTPLMWGKYSLFKTTNFNLTCIISCKYKSDHYYIYHLRFLIII